MGARGFAGHNAKKKAKAKLAAEAVTRLVAAGWTYPEIAKELGYKSRSTPRKLFEREYKKSPPLNLEAARARAALKHDAAERRLHAGIERCQSSKDEEGVARYERLLAQRHELRAKLEGTDAERRIDPDLVVSTAAATAAATASQTAQHGPAVQIILSSEVEKPA